MDLILGFILGRTMGSKNGILPLMLAPVAIALLFGTGVLVFYCASWYEAGVMHTSAPSAWYDWPWNWPGIQVAHSLLSTMNSVLGEFWGSNAAIPDLPPAVDGLAEWCGNFVGAMLAISVNVFVATLPLHVIGLTVRAWARLSKVQRKY